MPTYEIEIPGEGKFRVESSSELTDKQAFEHASKQAKLLKESDPTSGMTSYERGAAGAGKAIHDLGLGARQLLSGVPLLNKTDTFNPQKVQADVNEARSMDAPLMNTTAGQVGNFVGNAAITAPAMFVPGLNTYAGAGLLGAGMGALQPTTEGESRGLNMAAGAGAGLLGQGVGNAVGRFIKPVQSALAPEEAKLATEATKRGIPLSAGQATGSKPLQIMESVMENLPLTSGPQIAQRQVQKEAFNKAVGSTFGAPEASLTPEVMGEARKQIGSKFTDLASRNTLKATNSMVADLGNIEAQAVKMETPDVAHVVKGRLDDLLSKVDANGEIPGEAYRKFDSALGRTMRSTTNGDLRAALGDIRETVRDAMDASISGADQAAWKGARREYSNLMAVAPLAAKNETGDVSGKTLLAAANKANSNAKFGGPSELADLGRIGRAFVADKIPDSGTAQRQLIQSLITGGAGVGVGAGGAAATGHDWKEGALIGGGLTAGGLLAPRIIQAAMQSKAGDAYLKKGLLNLSKEDLARLTALSRAGSLGLLGNPSQK